MIHDCLPRLRFMRESVVYLFEAGFRSDGYNLPLILLLSSLPAVWELQQEMQNGYLKMAVARAGALDCFTGWIRGIWLGSALQALGGLLVFFVFLIFLMIVYGLPFYDPAANGYWAVLPDLPAVGILLRCLAFSLGASLWTAVSCLALVLSKDLFIALAVPVSCYMLMLVLLAIGLRVNIDSMLIIVGQQHFWLRLIRSAGGTAGLTGLCLLAAMRILAEQRLS